MVFAKINSQVAHYAPDQSSASNDDLAEIMDTSDDRISSRMKVSFSVTFQKMRRQVIQQQLLHKDYQQKQKLRLEEIDSIIVATITPDSLKYRLRPVQANIGAELLPLI